MTKRTKPVPTSQADIATLLLHEAVVYGWDYTVMAPSGISPVVGRRRPFVPAGTDPADINRECARRYAIWGTTYRGDTEWTVLEVNPALITPFLDVADQIAAADEHANRAQRRNRRGAGR